MVVFSILCIHTSVGSGILAETEDNNGLPPSRILPLLLMLYIYRQEIGFEDVIIALPMQPRGGWTF